MSRVRLLVPVLLALILAGAFGACSDGYPAVDASNRGEAMMNRWVSTLPTDPASLGADLTVITNKERSINQQMARYKVGSKAMEQAGGELGALETAKLRIDRLIASGQ